MDRSDHEQGAPISREWNVFEDPPRQAELAWLGEIVEQLDEDPSESWPAMESLTALDPATRGAIIGELASYHTKPGVRTLLRLLSTARDPSTRSLARTAFSVHDTEPGDIGRHPDGSPGPSGVPGRVQGFPSDPGPQPGVDLVVAPNRAGTFLDHSGIPIVGSLVTPVDGQGRATIVISSRRSGQRRTAAFWCDVRRGILDVVGDVESDTPAAGRLLDEWYEQAAGDSACDAPWVALRLLGGSWWLCGSAMPGPVRDWLAGILGPTFHPSGLSGSVPGMDEGAIPDDELAARAHEVLDACPAWLDRSGLTFELAEEITLREGLSAPDPHRDSGAYRFLFEHLIIHRLELYRRMLFWMAWVWQGSAWTGLARSAYALACQLSDEQYEVPSHPFTVALSTRSLEAAQVRLRTSEDPRSPDHRPTHS